MTFSSHKELWLFWWQHVRIRVRNCSEPDAVLSAMVSSDSVTIDPKLRMAANCLLTRDQTQ